LPESSWLISRNLESAEVAQDEAAEVDIRGAGLAERATPRRSPELQTLAEAAATVKKPAWLHSPQRPRGMRVKAAERARETIPTTLPALDLARLTSLLSVS